jgi:glycosyltransferase involved in cell wall biosynthesis
MGLSVAVIAKDEERYIGRLLASLGGCDDVVVLDTGSTDRTQDIALECGARVELFGWTGDFAEARNAATDLTRNEWVAWLDADMRVEDYAGLAAFTDRLSADYDGVAVSVHDGDVSFSSPRVYRRDVRFEGRIHEVPLCRKTVQTPFVLRHEREETAEERLAKNERYRLALLEELEREPSSAHALMYLRDYALFRGQLGEAADYARRHLAVEDDYRCHYVLGLIAYRAKERKEALDHGYRALQSCSTAPAVYTLIGDTYDELGRKLEALVWYGHALGLPPEVDFVGAKYATSREDRVVIPRVNKAKVLSDIGRRDDAVALYLEALAEHPTTVHRKIIEAHIATLRCR